MNIELFWNEFNYLQSVLLDLHMICKFRHQVGQSSFELEIFLNVSIADRHDDINSKHTRNSVRFEFV